MHVTIIGAGVLGRIYGVRMAASGARVSFVVRPERAAETTPFVIEQVNGGGRHDTLEPPERTTTIPEGSQIVLVTVRSHEIEPTAASNPSDKSSNLTEILRAGGSREAPAVILTPMMPAQQAALAEATGRRIVPAMPGVVGYLNDQGIVRYWVPAATSTLLGEPPATRGHGDTQHAAIEALARHLTKIGLPTGLERDLAALNAATTTAFFPLIAAIDAGSGIDGVLGNKELLAVVLEAAKESEALARKVGKLATWTNLLLRFVGPFTMKPGVALARRLSPESVQFVERHFGAKLHEQHIAMGESILALGREHGVSMPALTKLMGLLRSRPATAAVA